MIWSTIADMPDRRLILDIGTGTGIAAHLASAHHPAAMITAMDVSLDFLQQAKKRIGPKSLVQGSVVLLPFTNNQFDAVLSFGVLCHLVEPDRSLAEIYRVLQARGYVLLWTRGTDRWGRMLRLIFPLVGGGAAFTLYTPDQLFGLFKNVGFEQIIVREEAHGLLVRAVKPAL
ncbi:MAG: methyltransferase domain-containing protein [Candidatus Latescibacteria bacterium]|nr:methyltransferase domain-containing protein [Candidatus Latescibacterota bacterium]